LNKKKLDKGIEKTRENFVFTSHIWERGNRSIGKEESIWVGRMCGVKMRAHKPPDCFRGMKNLVDQSRCHSYLCKSSNCPQIGLKQFRKANAR
jgi:hypothetical protein